MELPYFKYHPNPISTGSIVPSAEAVQFAGNLEVRALAHSQNRRAYLAKSMYLKQQLHIKRSLTAHSGKTLNTAADKSRPGLCW